MLFRNAPLYHSDPRSLSCAQGYETAIVVVIVTTIALVAVNVLFSKASAPIALDPKKEIDFELIEREDLSRDTRRYESQLPLVRVKDKPHRDVLYG